MVESSFEGLEIADELLEFTFELWQRIRTDIPKRAGRELEAEEAQLISTLRATSGQVRLLRILSKHYPCTMQELAEHLGVAAPSVTAMVKRLLAQGFIERKRDEQDWRVVSVSPTEQGLRALALFDELRRESLRRRLDRLDKEELTRLRAALPVLRHLIEVEE